MSNKRRTENERLSAERLFGLQMYLERAQKLVGEYKKYNTGGTLSNTINKLEEFIISTELIFSNTEHLQNWDTISLLIVRGKQLHLDMD
ncbi:MAG: hypothetical protein AAB410_02085 [Patescibacteria group bacterium]